MKQRSYEMLSNNNLRATEPKSLILTEPGGIITRSRAGASSLVITGRGSHICNTKYFHNRYVRCNEKMYHFEISPPTVSSVDLASLRPISCTYPYKL